MSGKYANRAEFVQKLVEKVKNSEAKVTFYSPKTQKNQPEGKK